MRKGLLSGFFWGINTVIIGIALSLTPLTSTKEFIFLAPFISTFIHDFFSSIWMFIYMAAKKQSQGFIKALRSKSGKYIALAALVGGPVGMTGYILSIKYLGAGYTAIISALYPAVGAFLSYLFLKETMQKDQMIGLAFSVGGVVALGYTPGGNQASNLLLGFFFAIMCVVGWASEAVIISYGLQEQELTDEEALQIRQFTSAVFYGLILLPILKAWGPTINLIPTMSTVIILIAALFGTTSYLFYYKAINEIGATKAMALNITYSAWAIVFGFILLREQITGMDILLGLIIIGGSVYAAGEKQELFAFNRA